MSQLFRLLSLTALGLLFIHFISSLVFGTRYIRLLDQNLQEIIALHFLPVFLGTGLVIKGLQAIKEKRTGVGASSDHVMRVTGNRAVLIGRIFILLGAILLAAYLYSLINS